MTQVPSRQAGGLDALTAGNAASSRVPIPFELGSGCKLASGTDFYFELPVSDSPYRHVTMKWDINIIVTLSLETTSIPAKKDIDNSDDLKAWDNTAGNGWNQEPLTASSASFTDTTGGTGNASIASNTIIVGGGTVGCAGLHIGNLGSKRARIKAHVGGTGGVLRVSEHGKE